MIEVSNLDKWYGNTHAVKGVTFAVAKGEIVGLLGPNGAGKTTIMRVLTGYLTPTGGRVAVAGIDVREDPIKAKTHVGYLPETPPLYEDMTVRGYLSFVAEIKGVARDRRASAVEEAMGLTGCDDVAGRLIAHISRGYRQRVGIAQAIIHKPDIVILDEPTVGLDPRQIIEIRSLIKSLAGGHTVLLSTHILPEVSATCERIIIIHQGEIVATDTQEGLTRRLRGVEHLVVQIKGQRERIENVLRKVENIKAVHHTGSQLVDPAKGGENLHRFRLEVEKGKEVREALFDALAGEKLYLYELTSESLSLEEIFLRLTTEEPVEEAA